MPINEGEAFVAGLTAENAKQLLEAAEKAGLDPSVVRADADGGFVVPAELVEKPKKTAEPKKTEPKKPTATTRES